MEAPRNRIIEEIALGSATQPIEVENLAFAINSANVPHACYRADIYSETPLLDLARRNGGSWESESVDAASGIGLAFAFDPADQPAVCFVDAADDTLKLTTLRGGVWQTSSIEGPLLGIVPGAVSIAYAADGTAFVGFFAGDIPPESMPTQDQLLQSPNEHLKLAQQNGQEWTIASVDTEQGTGIYHSLALSADGEPQFAYYALASRTLKWASRSGNTWEIETVNEIDGGAAGEHPSLQIDTEGNPHIAYRSSEGLRYAHRNAGVWQVETVDAAPGAGLYATLVLNRREAPQVCYYDTRMKALKYGHRFRDEWIIETLDNSGDAGGFASMGIDNEGIHQVSYYDFRNDAIKYIKLNGPPSAGDTSFEFNMLVNPDQPLSENLLRFASDEQNDPLVVTTEPITPPANGTLTLQENGDFTYMPNRDFIGRDSFTYEVCDEHGLCAVGSAVIAVRRRTDNQA